MIYKFAVIDYVPKEIGIESGNYFHDMAFLYLGADPNEPNKNAIVISDSNPKNVKYVTIISQNFYLSEILILDESGREPSGKGRKPSKWNVGYKEFELVEQAIEYSQKIQNEMEVK